MSENRITVRNIIRRGNTLKADYFLTHENHFTEMLSPIYNFCNFAKFQFNVMVTRYNQEHTTIHIRFEKINENDNFTYVMEFSSDALRIDSKNLLSDDETWHVMFKKYERVASFDVTMKIDIVSSPSIFATLHDDTEMLDFELCGKDGSVQMHRSVLAASSPVLRRMLGGKWREASEGRIEMADISEDTLQHLKDYIYLHKLPDTGVEQLLLLSLYYMMPDLEKKCIFKLISDLTAENAYELLKFSTTHEEVIPLLMSILQCVKNDEVNIDEISDYLYKKAV